MSSVNGLTVVVALNEAAKDMREHSFQVRIRALDALVRSAKQQSSGLAGFREVSHQMRRWSDDLGSQLESLQKLCGESVVRESQFRTMLRKRRLMERAAQLAPAGALEHCLSSTSLRDAKLRSTRLAELHRTIVELEALTQLGLMAIVLSHTAMIEAAGAGNRERAVLSQVAREFGEHANSVLRIGKRLVPLARSVREAA